MPHAATVLYVEDESTDALLMKLAFEKAQLDSRLHTVPDGQTALDYLSGAGIFAERSQYPLPAVVLLDLNLPGMHGFEVLQWIRQHPNHKNLPVVVFSSSAREEDLLRAKALHADDYWQKPIASKLLLELVHQLQSRWLQFQDSTPTRQQPASWVTNPGHPDSTRPEATTSRS